MGWDARSDGRPFVLLAGALEEQGVYEGLRQVASQLTLCDVVLLGEEAWWAAGGAVALEPARGLDVAALLAVGERHDEAAEQESAFCLAEWPFVGPVAVCVALLCEFVLERL